MKRIKDKFDRQWITDTSVPIVKEYRASGIELTLRGLHYRLVAAGMTNTINHYKRVVKAMSEARWGGLIEFDDFKDYERSVIGSTDYVETDVHEQVDRSINLIDHVLTSYRKNRWENQPNYVEVFIEKKALIGVFSSPCSDNGVALCPCKGYPSLTYVKDAANRFKTAKRLGKKLIILYFGDYDASGEDIPRSLKSTILRMGVDVEVKRIALMKDQVIEWGLPFAPTKTTDTRAVNWDGLGQVELDSIEPRKLMTMTEDAINEVFDSELHDELLETQASERVIYIDEMKIKINDILDN